MTEQLIAIFIIGSLTAIQALFFRPAIANLLGWIQIKTKKPFRKGDFITCGDYEGVVKKIAMSGTTLKRTDRSTVTLPNSLLTSTPVINKSAFNLRPMSVQFTLHPSLSQKQMQTIIDRIYYRCWHRRPEGTKDLDLGADSMFYDPDVKVQSFDGNGTVLKVSAFNGSYLPHTQAKNIFMLHIRDIITSDQWPTNDVEVSIHSPDKDNA